MPKVSNCTRQTDEFTDHNDILNVTYRYIGCVNRELFRDESKFCEINCDCITSKELNKNGHRKDRLVVVNDCGHSHANPIGVRKNTEIRVWDLSSGCHEYWNPSNDLG